jgi:hypothetical protein
MKTRIAFALAMIVGAFAIAIAESGCQVITDQTATNIELSAGYADAEESTYRPVDTHSAAIHANHVAICTALGASLPVVTAPSATPVAAPAVPTVAPAAPTPAP